jgi:hypothetical protein
MSWWYLFLIFPPSNQFRMNYTRIPWSSFLISPKFHKSTEKRWKRWNGCDVHASATELSFMTERLVTHWTDSATVKRFRGSGGRRSLAHLCRRFFATSIAPRKIDAANQTPQPSLFLLRLEGKNSGTHVERCGCRPESIVRRRIRKGRSGSVAAIVVVVGRWGRRRWMRRRILTSSRRRHGRSGGDIGGFVVSVVGRRFRLALNDALAIRVESEWCDGRRCATRYLYLPNIYRLERKMALL